MSRNVVIGIAGGTASGKTSIAEVLFDAIGAEHALLLRLDDYYHRLDGDLEARRRMNFDHPDAFEWPLVESHVGALVEGQSVNAPRYDQAASQRRDEEVAVEPRPLIIVEGILALWHASLREFMDIKVFIDAPADIRLARRLRRDVNERARTVESVLERHESTVQPMHHKFCEPTKGYADLIIPHGSANRVAVDMMLFRLKGLVDPDERRRFLAS